MTPLDFSEERVRHLLEATTAQRKARVQEIAREERRKMRTVSVEYLTIQSYGEAVAAVLRRKEAIRIAITGI